MNKEIERKFLVYQFDKTLAYDIIDIKQGYVFSDEDKVVRVRTWNDKGYLTLKYRAGENIRDEYEYEIPKSDADKMLCDLCKGNVLSKTRYLVMYEGKKWEVDIFHGINEGLMLAEIELNSENEGFAIPSFAVLDVTGNPKYSNHNIAKGNVNL